MRPGLNYERALPITPTCTEHTPDDVRSGIWTLRRIEIIRLPPRPQSQRLREAIRSFYQTRMSTENDLLQRCVVAACHS